MSANTSALLTVNPIVVYSVLGFYGVFTAAVLLYVYHKFSHASRVLNSLKEEWELAKTAPTELLSVEPSATATPVPQPRLVSFDTRNQVMSMGRKGLGASDIARAFAMTEAEVNVLLGLARIQQ